MERLQKWGAAREVPPLCQSLSLLLESFTVVETGSSSREAVAHHTAKKSSVDTGGTEWACRAM